MIGTTRRFASIAVKDLPAAFAPDVRVESDGGHAGPRDLRIGHVVRVLARPHGPLKAAPDGGPGR